MTLLPLINKDTAQKTIQRRKKNQDIGLTFLNNNNEIFEAWATSVDRKSGDEWKGVVQQHNDDTTGCDIIQQTFTNSDWSCKIAQTGQSDAFASFEVVITF